MATATQYSVHTGLWINWSNGRVFGATLTLTRSDGALLTAFLALTVTVIGAQLWRIFCFTTHYLLSSATKPGDALYHQIQAVLRNTSEPAGGVVKFLQLGLAWNRRGVRALYRTLPVLLATVIITIGTAIGSGFSSKIAVGNEVLLSGDNCSWVEINGNTDAVLEYTLIGPYTATKLQVDATYAQQCYPRVSSPGELGCQTFIRQKIPFDVITNATCPFSQDTSICRSNDSNIIVDTGLIDSHFDMGLNLPPSERFQYRRVMSCAPLSTDGRHSVYNLSATRSNVRYFYGPYWSDQSGDSNYTYQTSSDAYSDRDSLELSGAFPKYSVRAFTAAWQNGSLNNWGTTFAPIPEITVPDADLKLLFLSGNGMYFSNITNDPWYEATTLGPIGHPLPANESSGIQIYYQDQPGSPMGCVHRSQYCRPQRFGDPVCTALTGELDLYYSVLETFTDEHAFNRVSWFQTMVDASFWPEDIVGRGDINLEAQYRVRSGVQGPLPDNQWQLEVQYWFSIMLASMQRTFVDTATGPSDASLEQYRVPPANVDEKNLCLNQKILSPDHMSFSVFGLLFIFTFGAVVTFLGFTLDSIVGWVQARMGSDPYHRLEWCLNNTLQLQRLAHEELGHSTWERGTKCVPVTSGDAMLGMLDVSDVKHPSLRIVEHEREMIVRKDSQPGASETSSLPTLQVATTK
ncbi:hypothetical protein F5Y19DRAFT_479921 [Xylariaceae sp. FL1651]|nr:hypothetical protein F5Y19DRAFT_479921 [Xylariaceae sp. FL1651]